MEIGIGMWTIPQLMRDGIESRLPREDASKGLFPEPVIGTNSPSLSLIADNFGARLID